MSGDGAPDQVPVDCHDLPDLAPEQAAAGSVETEGVTS